MRSWTQTQLKISEIQIKLRINRICGSRPDPDTLHYNAAMNASDADEFKAMLQEVNAHTRMTTGKFGENGRSQRAKTFTAGHLGISSASAESILNRLQA
jgi:hypothetical protein